MEMLSLVDAMSTSSMGLAVASLHYIYPTIIFGYFIVSAGIAVCMLQSPSAGDQHVRRGLVLSLTCVVVLTYLAQISAILVISAFSKRWLGQPHSMIGLLSCILVFGIELVSLSGASSPVWHPYLGSFIMALMFDVVIAILSPLVWPNPLPAVAQILDVSIIVTRCLLLSTIVGLYFYWRRSGRDEDGSNSERQALLQKDDGPPGGVTGEADGSDNEGYGTSYSSTDASEPPVRSHERPSQRTEREAAERMQKRLREHGNWFSYVKSFSILFPYIWPVNDKSLQFRAGLVGICLLARNALNVLIPRQTGVITDSLSKTSNANPWVQVVIFVALKFAASDAGISLLRSWLWSAVESYSAGALSKAAYTHILNLSADFHDSKSSSDLVMAMHSGQEVSSLLESVCFQAVPMLIDMGAAFVYLSVTFGPYEGFITTATAIIFFIMASRMIAALGGLREVEMSAWYEEHYVRQAGIQGWTTVAGFNQVDYEAGRYSRAVGQRVAASRAVQLGYILSWALQTLVLFAGLVAGAFLAVYQVTSGVATPGQFVMLLMYWTQLAGPLTFFAGLGKSVSKSLIGAEGLLDILRTKPSVVSRPGAPPLSFTGGAVHFKNVFFSYDQKKPILKNLNFYVPAGSTVAFVGTTGAGKSTVFKLLHRFYDASEGSIEIDGQNIRDVDLQSLRAQIGVVYQNPLLFDDTVINNVRYAKLDATDEDVVEACKAADIHEQILGFTDGYQTQVGEQGVKLSGGQQQRIAIARAILKKPEMILLDEATSSVDTETEHKIQEALTTLCEGRTTFIVAHRLSTIMNADSIMVVSGGEIVERGCHEELIRAHGKYAELWSKQVFAKPRNKHSTENSPGNETPKLLDIVNDLTTETTVSEMAKLGAGVTKEAEDEEGQELVRTPSGHKREGSKLNPDAPNFTPRSLLAAIMHTPRRNQRGMACDPFQPASVEATTAVSMQSRTSTPVVSLPTTASNVVEMCRSPLELRETRRPSDGNQSTTAGSKGGKSQRGKFKHPRYSRRIQSKSEPSATRDV